MDEQALALQIEEGKVAVAAAQNLISAHKKIYDEAGTGDDLFAEVLASDNFTPEFKDIVKKERVEAIAKIEQQMQQNVQLPGKRSRIAGHAGVTKI